jgi:hypothetical protein
MNAEMIVSGRGEVVRQKNMVISSAGLETKNDCAGENQQQFNRQTVLL